MTCSCRTGQAVLRPVDTLNLKQLVRTFTLRTSEGLVESFGPGLVERKGAEAPGVRLRFMQKPDRDSTLLRDGTVDLETGVLGKTTGPEVRAQALFRDRFIDVAEGARAEPGQAHSLPLCGRRAHPVSRRGLDRGPIEEALRPFGLQRPGRHDGHWLCDRAGSGPVLRPDRHVPERQTGSCAPECTAFPFRSRARESRFRCSGTRGWTRSGASLAARLRSGCLQGVPTLTIA